MLRMKRFGKDKITQKKLIPNTLPSPDIRALLLQLPGCHAFCKKNCKKHAPALRFRKKALVAGEWLHNSGKSPCRSTGKANIQIVARASAKRQGPLYTAPAPAPCREPQHASSFVTLLAG